MDIVEHTKSQLRSCGIFEGAVTADYIKTDVDKALQAAHIEKADVSVGGTGDTIFVVIKCRDATALKEAGANVVKHLESEEVPVNNVDFQELKDGVWEFTFDVDVVEPVH